MEILSKDVTAGVKFYIEVEGREVARAYLYTLRNDLHERPFGFMEDVFVDESLRGQGVGTSLVKRLIDEARNRDCYKLICTSRYANEAVHDLYARLGYADHGKEFRINF
ncbi:GNAT family N-acetyltransferase [Candidatus Woesearchaeota archaeon]|nr:GNAT family N-acetyltransferase [Candidatus Woesearchaeota archaeon]